ncbi:MAG TPA: TlpA disulfide reductase family protein [Methylophilaceae bacterium]|jgi:peroxiredoxin
MPAFKKLWLPILSLLLVAGLWFALVNPDRAPQVVFTSLEGKRIALADLKGHMVLVNFWATSCPGCVKEMPQIADTYRQYHDKGFEVIGVAMAYDPPDNVLNYAKKNALPFPVSLDIEGKISHLFGDVQVTPSSFVIDKRGNVVRRVIGELDFADLRQLLTTQIAK